MAVKLEINNERSGTQSIERAITIMREIATRGQFGWQLSDLAECCHLSRSTTHRILVCLVRERLVAQMPDNRHYKPGPMMFELGLALPEFGELQYVAKNRLQDLAKRTGAMAFLFFRSGDEFVCAVRIGNLDMRALTVFPGTRRPLASSAGGVAILLKLPTLEAKEIVTRNLVHLREYGFSKDRSRSIFRMLERTREEGKSKLFAVNAGDIVPGVHAFGHTLCDPEGAPFGSIVLAGPPQLLPLEHIPKFRSMMRDIAIELQEIPFRKSRPFYSGTISKGHPNPDCTAPSN